jgi:hypothetical protein
MTTNSEINITSEQTIFNPFKMLLK